MARVATSNITRGFKNFAKWSNNIKNASVLVPNRPFSVSLNNKMKFIQFTFDSPSDLRVGVVKGNKIIDLNAYGHNLTGNLVTMLRNGQLEEAKKIAREEQATIPLSSVKLLPPVSGMDKVICIGLNYKDHCDEQNLTIPEVPMFFSKFASCIIGPEDPLKLRMNTTQKVDWEVELVVVIGQEASYVSAANAYDYILGYTIAQDISARDWQKQKNGGQFLLGKSMDTFCPIGPYIVTKDAIKDPQGLDIECSINGVLKQKSNTNQLINKIPDVIERLSSVMTLLPGDIILTGTPGGVGMYRQPPEYLKPGDVIKSEIQCIGVLETKVEEYLSTTAKWCVPPRSKF